MSKTQFTAFYPSRPFWAGNAINFKAPSVGSQFNSQMAEEVYSKEANTFAIKVCRDGRILLRVATLEQTGGTQTSLPPIEETVRRWGEYLDYLNAFYLLLDSSTIELDHLAHFNLHEITNRDAFRVTYEDGKSIGEAIATESVGAVFQMGRYSSQYQPGVPIELDARIARRNVISIDAIARAADLFSQVVAQPGLEKTLASFAKSLSEYKVGNYETSVLLAWFITETAINHLWRTHIDELNVDLDDKRKRINSDRKKYLNGRDFPVSLISNLLELWDVLPHSLFEDIDSVRGFRNRIVHGENFSPGAGEAQRAMSTAREMIKRRWSISFIPSMGYSVAGL